MAQIALGEVKPSSTVTALRATDNQSGTKVTYFSCQAIQFQVLAANSGSVYICDRQTPTLTQHVHMELLAPNASPATRPSWSVGNPSGPNTLNAAEYWILPAIAGNGVRITLLET